MTPVKYESFSPHLPLEPLQAPELMFPKPWEQIQDQSYATSSRQRSTSSELVVRTIAPRPAPVVRPQTLPISKNDEQVSNPMAFSYQAQPKYTNTKGEPLRHLVAQQYVPTPTAALTPIHPSSGAWKPTEDQTLMAARSQGMNWAPIQQSYFPNKSPNACRKRHERLMERRSAEDWDDIKLENLAKSYMGMRREIWQGLAAQTGDKWNVVEQKV
jgi:hypothetical protein